MKKNVAGPTSINVAVFPVRFPSRIWLCTGHPTVGTINPDCAVLVNVKVGVRVSVIVGVCVSVAGGLAVGGIATPGTSAQATV